MCTAFSEWAQKQGWTPYPETAGWDILLVAADGTQIGVQAKLQFNMRVLQQSLDDGFYQFTSGVGPDFRAVLLPLYDRGAEQILGALGLTLFRPIVDYGRTDFRPELAPRYHAVDDWHYWNPVRRCKLPEYVPDVQPGASGPVQLTEWKIRALRIAATLEIRGHVTRADFKFHRVDPRRWLGWFPDGQEWLLPGAEPGQFVKGPGLRFAEQHPVVFAQIRDEIAAELEPA